MADTADWVEVGAGLIAEGALDFDGLDEEERIAKALAFMDKLPPLKRSDLGPWVDRLPERLLPPDS